MMTLVHIHWSELFYYALTVAFILKLRLCEVPISFESTTIHSLKRHICIMTFSIETKLNKHVNIMC